MASSKARARNRSAAGGSRPVGAGNRAQKNGGAGGTRSSGASANRAAGNRAQQGGGAAGTRVQQGGGAAGNRAQQRRRPEPELVEQPPAGPPMWLRLAAFVLALAGLGVSIYLTYTHFTDSTLAGCSEKAGAVNCTKVTTSSQSMIFGVIPVAVTGLVYYVFMAAIMSPWAWKATWKWMPWLRLATVIAGIGMVLYLVYAELFQIDAICLYCTSVHIITFVLFALIVVSAAIWGLAPARPADPT